MTASRLGRDRAIDQARGWAIIVMVAANMAPVLVEPHNFAFRLLSSFPAPLFAVLAGMMVVLTSAHKDWPAIIKRSALLFAAAAFVDMAAWKLVPFVGMDILYLVAVGTPLVYALRNVKTPILLILIALFILGAFVLQNIFGYTDYPTEITLYTLEIESDGTIPTSVLQHYFIDGWFSLFPWLGFMLFGILLARVRWSGDIVCSFVNRNLILYAVITVLAGSMLWYAYPGAMYVRQGLSELFYPPTPGFFITMVGAVMLFIALMDYVGELKFFEPVIIFGRASLFVYIIHYFVIDRFFTPLWSDNRLDTAAFTLYYLAFLVCLFVAAAIWVAHIRPQVRRILALS